MAATDSRGEDVRVAVLGTGIMGSAMARNLVSAGLRTTVWDRSPRRLRRCPMPGHWWQRRRRRRPGMRTS